MLKVENLSVEVAGKRVLEGVDLEVPRGEVHVLFGPNGSGKTSFIMAVLGFPSYRVTSGKIRFDGTDITATPINERVKLGIGVAFQTPPAIRGVKLGDILRHLAEGETEKLIEAVNLPPELLGRDLNLAFSGGELKRSEVLQVLAQKPKFAIFDEPDSGVDVENLEVVGRSIENFFENRTGLLITHLGYILRYVKADRAHVMFNGTVACSGKPEGILNQIMKKGYKWCERCPRVRRLHSRR